MDIEGLPVIDVDESDEITVAVSADDLREGDTSDPDRHPIAIALRRQKGVDDARVTESETLVRRGRKWFRLRRTRQAPFQGIAEDAGRRLIYNSAMVLRSPRGRPLGGPAAFIHPCQPTVGLDAERSWLGPRVEA
jgi:hypothetical protein